MAEAIAFEEALTELQQLVNSLESGQVALHDSLARYERGVQLIAHCQSLLDQAHQRIEIVVRRTASGAIETAPFDLPATVEDPSPSRAVKKKPRTTKESPPKERGLFEAPSSASPAPATGSSRDDGPTANPVEEAPFD